jgi:predicted dehydrogenase
VRMDVPRKVYYEKELELRLSRSYGPGRYDPEYEEKGHDYPVGYVRWTERRNMEEFLRLVSIGRVAPARLTTHRFTIDDAQQAYALIGGHSQEPFAGVVLTYPEAGPRADADARLSRSLVVRPTRAAGALAGVGVIGGGNFARAVLLPRLARRSDASLVGIVTSTGATAKGAAERFGFGYASTDAQRVLDDPAVHAVVIATRHASHARLASRALRAGKAVFVEKPLAIDEEGLDEVLAAQAESGGLLAVGFNRRFSPLAREMKRTFDAALPLAITYRVNAGAIPAEHWTQDPQEGGGRVIGEACHFVDFCQFLTDDAPVEVYAAKLGGRDGALGDTVSVTIRYARGSVASIHYFATGDKSVGKERVEAFGGGTIAVLDDFRTVSVSRDGHTSHVKRRAQEKGFDEEIEAFLGAVRTGGEPPIDVATLASTTRVTFAALESLATGLPVALR